MLALELFWCSMFGGGPESMARRDMQSMEFDTSTQSWLSIDSCMPRGRVIFGTGIEQAGYNPTKYKLARIYWPGTLLGVQLPWLRFLRHRHVYVGETSIV